VRRGPLSMTSSHLKRLIQLFQAAIELPAEERRALLAGLGEPQELRLELEPMLSAHEADPAILDSAAGPHRSSEAGSIEGGGSEFQGRVIGN
jgi:hypothetical protein